MDAVTRTRSGFEISFGIYASRRGRKNITYLVACEGVREIKLSDFDGGGIRLYPRTHPAARQFGIQAKLQWPSRVDLGVNVGALYTAHEKLVGDWIPFERFAEIRQTKTARHCLGPLFLLRAYARELKSSGEEATVRSLGKSNVKLLPRVLHFGESYVVADRFSARVIGPSTAL